MSKRVIGIAAGEAHTLALTDDGSVFSWGRGTFGRLGTGKEEDELSPVPVSFADVTAEKVQRKFVAVAAGAYHSLALQDDGSVWSWGYNIYGQLGHGEENASVPCLVERFQELGATESLSEASDQNHDKKPLKVCSISAGGMMSLAIDSLGALWVWGNSPQPSTTESEEVFCLMTSSPLPVRDFHGHTVVKVACGTEHIVAAVSAGETYVGGNLVCYSWGNNSHGQLGLGDKIHRPCPIVIPSFNKDSPWSIYEIACGAYHSAVLTRRESYDEQEMGSKCWTFGLGDNGQLGHGTTVSAVVPEPVTGLPPDTNLISVDCGLFHTCTVSAAGEVWSWGMEKGLGLCPEACFTANDAGDALSPLPVTCTETAGGKFAGPVQVACGAAHTVLVAEDGHKLWAWGRGRSGVLGRGQEVDSFVPCTVMWPPPLDADFKEEEESRDGAKNVEAEEVRILKEKLLLMERYATMLHVSVFRKPFDHRKLSKSLQESSTFDIWRELESAMDSADTDELAHLEAFYRSMLSTVKDKLMRRRIQEMVKESLISLSKGRQMV